jgi:hypothetical protein
MYKVEFNKDEMKVIQKALSKLDAALWVCEKRAVRAGKLIGDDDRNYNALNAAIGILMEAIYLNR